MDKRAGGVYGVEKCMELIFQISHSNFYIDILPQQGVDLN
jgi:hypothetical protein